MADDDRKNVPGSYLNQMPSTRFSEDAELTRLREELDEARRHAKVLAEMLSPYKEYSDEVEAALDYVEKLPCPRQPVTHTPDCGPPASNATDDGTLA